MIRFFFRLGVGLVAEKWIERQQRDMYNRKVWRETEDLTMSLDSVQQLFNDISRSATVAAAAIENFTSTYNSHDSRVKCR